MAFVEVCKHANMFSTSVGQGISAALLDFALMYRDSDNILINFHAAWQSFQNQCAGLVTSGGEVADCN